MDAPAPAHPRRFDWVSGATLVVGLVIAVWLVSFGSAKQAAIHQVTQAVDDQQMHFLNPGRALVGHTDFDVASCKEVGDLSPTAACQGDHRHPTVVRRPHSLEHIG